MDNDLNFDLPNANDRKKNEKIRWRNIYLSLIQQILATLMNVMTTGSLMDIFIFTINNKSSSSLGNLYTVTGILLLVSSYPIGTFVDKYPQIYSIIITIIFTLLGLILGLLTVIFENTILLFSYYIVVTIAQQLGTCIALTIFTQSLTINERLKYYPLRGTIGSLGATAGPIIQIIYFLLVSNVWDLKFLKIFLIGTISIIYPLTILTYALFQEVNILLIKDELKKETSSKPNYHLIVDSESAPSTSNPETQQAYNPNNQTDTAVIKQDQIIQNTNTVDTDSSQENVLKGFMKYSPYINLLTSFIRSMGSGTMIKYIPIFFVETYQFSPINISVAYLAFGILISIGIQVSKIIARYLGRPLTSFASSVCAFAFCLSFGFSYTAPTSLLCFLSRAFFQNSIRHLDNTFMMDFIPNNQRGRFNSVLSFSNVYFGGTAFIGGYLSDNYSYRATFLAASCFFLLGLLVYFPIILFLPKSERPQFRIKNLIYL